VEIKRRIPDLVAITAAKTLQTAVKAKYRGIKAENH
jgi:hypothetical protein